MTLTKRNYFTIKNRYLSNSKISDWLKDKKYFYDKHVLGTVKQKVTDSMILGSAADAWLTEGEKKFLAKYIVVSRRDTKAENYEFQLNQSMFDKVEAICRKTLLQTAFKALRGYKKQEILTMDMKIGEHFVGLCGIPDFFKVAPDKKSAIIVDLKTTDNANPQKYFYKCMEFGYYRAMAMYGMLIAHNFKVPLNNIEYRHLVVEKDPDDLNRTYCYLLAQEKVKDEVVHIWKVIEDIQNEKKFLAHDATWDKMEVI